MKNKEFFKDKLIEIASYNLAVNKHTGEVEACSDMGCGDCLFYGKELRCQNKRKKWLNEEYGKQPVLGKDEKRILEEMLRPFKDRVECIGKKLEYDSRLDGSYERLRIKLKFLSEDSWWYELLAFRPGSIYKGMDIHRNYTIEELGLFQDGGDSDEE